MRGGDTEYIDVLFVYTDGLLQAQTGADAEEKLGNLTLSITRTVELTNTIFSQCHIPLEVSAADVTLARNRAVCDWKPLWLPHGWLLIRVVLFLTRHRPMITNGLTMCMAR